MKKFLLLSILLSLLVPSIAYATETITNGETDFKESTTIKVGYGYVTFQALPEPGIHQTLYLDVLNIHTYETFAMKLYEKNEYKTCLELPAGVYIMTNGGVPNDFTYAYPPELKEFEVEANTSSYVSFTVGDPEKIATTDITKPPKEVEIKVSYNEGETHYVGEPETNINSGLDVSQKEKENKYSIWNMIKSLFLPTAIIIALVVYLKRKK